MKTIQQLILLAVFCLSTTMYAANNNLIIFSQDGNKFSVVLNGLQQNSMPETNVKITGLNAPNYKVKIIFANGAVPSFDQTVYLMEGGTEVSNKEFSYSLELKKSGEWKLKPNSIGDIPQTTVATPNQVVYVYNPSGNATPAQTTTTVSTTTTTSGQTGNTVIIADPSRTGTTSTTTTTTNGAGTTQQTTTTTTSGSPNAAGVNMNVGGVGMNVVIYDNMGGTTTQQTTTTTTTTGATTVQQPQPVQDDKCHWAMSATDFANAKASVEKQSFEDDKLKVAKQILSSNCMSSAQVKQIMTMFSYEETKLEWAKFAYGKTTDPQNYYQLNDGFTYSSSVDALNAYIETQK